MTDKIMGSLVSLLGIWLLFMCIKTLIQVIKSKSYTGSIQAEVVEVEMTTSVSKGRKYFYYAPVFQYRVNGTVYRKKYEHSTQNPDKYQEGQMVPIVYNESKPDEFLPEGSSGKLVGNLLLYLAVGGVMLYVGVGAIMGRF